MPDVTDATPRRHYDAYARYVSALHVERAGARVASAIAAVGAR